MKPENRQDADRLAIRAEAGDLVRVARVRNESEIFEGFVDADFSGPACALDEPTAVTVRVARRNRTTLALEELDPPKTKTVYVSDPDLTGVADAYCRWQRIGGVLQFVYVGCNSALDGCGSSSSGGIR
jgi:hypothetical protein